MEKEKLNSLKQQFQSLSQQCQQLQSQCQELSEEELKEVTGGSREAVVILAGFIAKQAPLIKP